MKSRKSPDNPYFIRRILAIVVFCLLFLPVECFGKTVAEYVSELKSAYGYTQELIDYVDEAAEDEDARDSAYEREVLAEIRRALPPTEKIEWEGGSVETGNQWLELKLKEFEEEKKDWQKRRTILSAISERLSAIEYKLTNFTKKAANRSKDEDKQKLGEILRRADYQKPEEKQESWFERVQRKIREWFDEKFPQPQVPQGAGESMKSVSFGLQIVLYALVLGFIAFVIYRFAPFFAKKFRRGEREDKGERVILGEKLAADEDSNTLFDEAEALAKSGNLRAAIRKGYIALLCELNDRRVIGLAQHKTNRDYLRDVRKKDALYRDMRGLTDSFERHWYGSESADEADWQEFKRTYKQAITSEK